jgi:hypothetical protein
MSGIKTPTGHEKLNPEEGGTFFRNQELLTEPVKTKESYFLVCTIESCQVERIFRACGYACARGCMTDT